jgi:hypothetical protein
LCCYRCLYLQVRSKVRIIIETKSRPAGIIGSTRSIDTSSLMYEVVSPEELSWGDAPQIVVMLSRSGSDVDAEQS